MMVLMEVQFSFEIHWYTIMTSDGNGISEIGIERPEISVIFISSPNVNVLQDVLTTGPSMLFMVHLSS